MIKTNIPGEYQVPEFEILFTSENRKDKCVVIPVINEGNRIHSLLAKMQKLNISQTADIIIVDGGSTDGSLKSEKLHALGVHTLLLKTGLGRLSSQLRCAYFYALQGGYEHVVTIDGNDKDEPSTIPDFFDRLENGYDFVQGSRFIPGGKAMNTPLVRFLAIRLLHAPILSIASRFWWTDTTQGYRGYSKKLITSESLKIFRNIFQNYELLAFLSAKAPRVGLKCIEIPTTRVYPKGKVPTKISSFRGNLSVLKTLLAAAFGKYDPLA